MTGVMAAKLSPGRAGFKRASKSLAAAPGAECGLREQNANGRKRASSPPELTAGS